MILWFRGLLGWSIINEFEQDLFDNGPEIKLPAAVTRVEVIDNTGRVYANHGVTEAFYQMQDDGCTLKLFVNWGDSEPKESK